MWHENTLSRPVHPHDCVLAQVICSVLIWAGETCTWVLRTDDELWTERLYSCLRTRFVHLLPQSVDLKNNSLPACFGQVKIFLYQIIFIPILLRIIQRYQTTKEDNCRESRKHGPCGIFCGNKADTIQWKSPGPFPWCLSTIIILSMFDPFPVSWTRTPETLQMYSLS